MSRRQELSACGATNLSPPLAGGDGGGVGAQKTDVCDCVTNPSPIPSRKGRGGTTFHSRILTAIFLLAALLISPTLAAPLSPEQEARAVALGQAFRCVVCQAESINDSQAEMAQDLRRLVREKIAAGDTDEQIRAYVRARYGDYVLLRPPVQPNTWLLWLLPALIILTGGLGVFRFLRQRHPAPNEDDRS